MVSALWSQQNDPIMLKPNKVFTNNYGTNAIIMDEPLANKVVAYHTKYTNLLTNYSNALQLINIKYQEEQEYSNYINEKDRKIAIYTNQIGYQKEYIVFLENKFKKNKFELWVEKWDGPVLFVSGAILSVAGVSKFVKWNINYSIK